MSNRWRIFALAALLCTVLVPAIWAQSQATTGVIEGTVSDDAGAPLPGVSLTLRNTETNFTRVVVTDVGGRFRAVALPLGPYDVSAALEGFATLVQEGLQLTVGQTISLSFTMQLSAVEDQIVVTDAAAVVETSKTNNSVTINREDIEGLPNNGRNFLDLTKLTPGVTLVQGPDGDELTVNGQKGIQNNISVDGADFNNPFFGEQRGGQRPAFTFNLDAVQEFVVVADGAPPEFGRSSGGFVNVVTKSGTNAWRGTAHVFYQDEGLSSRAERADGKLEPKFDDEQFQTGFTLGGPIKQDKIFFFTAYDFQAGDSTKQKDPTRIDQRVVDALAAIGSPNENAPIDRTNDAQVFLGKIDWNLNARNLLTLRYNATESEQLNGTFDVDSWGASANSTEKDSSHAGTGSLITTIGSTAVNELRFQIAREDRPRSYEGPNLTATGRPMPDTAFDFGRGFRFGMPFFIPVDYHDTRWQVNNNFSWIKGEHNVKVGFEYNQTSAFQTFIGFANGRFIFDSTDGFLNYLENPNYVTCSDGSSSQLGACPVGTDITGPVLLYLQLAGVDGRTPEQAGTQIIIQEEPAIFVQDTWQPKSNLTITYGVRFEQQLNPKVQTPPDEVFFSDFIGTTREGQVFPSDGRIPDAKDMIQPRLAIAWDPWENGKTVLRATGGLFYARVPGLVLASTRSTNGSIGQNLFRNSELIPILGPPPAFGELLPTDDVGGPFRPDVFVFDKDFENPRTEAYSFSIEHEVMPRGVVTFKYNYARTKHLTRFVNRNDPLLSADPSDGLGPWSTGLDGGFNGVGQLTVVESSADSLYQGLTVGFTKRARNLDFQFFYTYSKDRSNDDNERDPFTFRYARVTDLDAEWGFSDRDQRDRLNAWVLWRAPYGIDVNARYSYRSAQPQSITADGSVANTPQDRINPDGSITPRNLGRKDNEFNGLDLRLSKIFKAGNLEIEGIIETFNVFGEKNLRAPETTNLIFNFDGTVQSGLGDPRQVQLGIRVIW